MYISQEQKSDMIKEAFRVCTRSLKTSQRDHHNNVDRNENPKQQKIRRGRWQVQESRLAIDQFVALPTLTGPNTMKSAKTMMRRRAGRHQSRHSLSPSADHAIERGVVQFVASNLKHALAFVRAPGACFAQGGAVMAVCSPTSAPMLTRSSFFTSVQWSQIASRCEPCTIRNVEVQVRCSVQSAVVTSMAAMLLTASSSQVVLAELHSRTGNMCQIAALPDTSTVLQLDTESGNEEGGPAAMTAGMTMRNFNAARYAGRWFEVASLKLGFAGQGQEDCHCTQGVYTFDEKNQAIQVETFCVHGSPTGYITGIRGRVQCVTDAELSKLKISEFERMQMIRQKCFLRFPNLPFIPRQPYNVIATDYDNYALVSGAKDASFIQIYSRTPNPGREFIDTQKKLLGTLGYDEEDIKDTPQDCEETSMNDLQSMMANPGLENAMSNRFSTLGLSKGVQLNPFTSSLETLRKLIELYVPKFN